jgi:CubicO group peptidase (beta-lactamase class C family)
LIERGKLQLDARVAGIIPEFARNGKHTITVRHLLTHTGGFREADKVPEHLDWEESIARICGVQPDPEWVPGERAGYHIHGSWYILGELIRRIDGRMPDRFVREEILEPCGMNDSWMVLPDEVLTGHPHTVGQMFLTHDIAPAPHPFLNRERQWKQQRPGSSMRGPVRDLVRFYHLLLKPNSNEGTPVLKPSSIQNMIARQREGLFDQTFQHLMDWGFGVIINSAKHGRSTVPYGFGLHASDDTFGHGGMQSSCGFADPKHQLAVAWVFNGMPGEMKHQLRARELNTLIYEDLGLTSERNSSITDEHG